MYYVWVAIAIIALGLLAAAANLLRSMQNTNEEGEPVDTVNPVDMECCGQHEVCEKESLLAALSKDIEYFDDEELDRFRGRRAEEYTEEETDEFRDILYTMREDEVAGWVRSLQLRQIEPPEGMKEEIYLIVGELRTSRDNKTAD